MVLYRGTDMESSTNQVTEEEQSVAKEPKQRLSLPSAI